MTLMEDVFFWHYVHLSTVFLWNCPPTKIVQRFSAGRLYQGSDPFSQQSWHCSSSVIPTFYGSRCLFYTKDVLQILKTAKSLA